jgi:hypothetical protein
MLQCVSEGDPHNAPDFMIHVLHKIRKCATFVS